ncbi:DUF192 domain-containing protein [Patescibacteria group bacterium]|nr:DUF192 domain-containing protein [Patescibacteria group bacterium]
MKKQIPVWLIAAVCIVVLLGGYTIYHYKTHPLGAAAVIRSHRIALLLAVTPSEKDRGLGHRDSLPPDTGMLFPFDRKARYQFWMKGMRFPLDFVWIADKKVADITQNVPPPAGSGPLPVYQPSVPVDQVLELNAGSVARLHIAVGDTVIYTF